MKTISQNLLDEITQRLVAELNRKGSSLDETKIHCPEVSPYPFAQETEIRYQVAQAGPVKLHIFSDNDRLIKTLIDAKHAAGEF